MVIRNKIIFAFVLSYISLNLALGQCTVVGWASENGGVNGGGNTTPTIVNTYALFKSAVENKNVKVIHVSGTITIPSGGMVNFQDQSAKTIFGLPNSKIVSADLTASNSGSMYVKRCSNIILQNLTFEGPGAYDVDGRDLLVIDNSTNVWIDHCDFQDGLDGNLDIKNMADYVSVTWTKFSYKKAPIPDGPGGSDDHRFSNLFGSGDDATQDRGKLRITLYNCWWAEGCKARMPRVRFGKVHVANSYYNTSASTYCVQAGFEADILVENNVFENVKFPIDLMDGKSTAVSVRGNDFINTTGNILGKGTSFTPPYNLQIIEASKVKAQVTASAGATLKSSSCTIPVNIAPVVGITAPINNATFNAPASIIINANATDTNGTIAKVEFYNGSTLLGTDQSTPYSYTWPNVTAGTYTITAKATDNLGATTTSSPISVVVNTIITDCNGTQNGTAKLDNCDRCAGGNTNKVACTSVGEAETDACSFDGTIDNNNINFKGSGFINVPNAIGSKIMFSINSTTASSKTISFRYANGGSTNRTGDVVVNGNKVGTLNFTPTGNFTTYLVEDIAFNLVLGDNIVQIISTTADGLANIDQIGYVSVGLKKGNCTITSLNYKPIESNLISVYPNPFEDTFELKLMESFTYDLIDYQGVVIESGRSDSENLQLGNNLSAGIYLLKIYRQSLIHTFKICKR